MEGAEGWARQNEDPVFKNKTKQIKSWGEARRRKLLIQPPLPTPCHNWKKRMAWAKASWRISILTVKHPKQRTNNHQPLWCVFEVVCGWSELRYLRDHWRVIQSVPKMSSTFTPGPSSLALRRRNGMMPLRVNWFAFAKRQSPRIPSKSRGGNWLFKIFKIPQSRSNDLAWTVGEKL